jgi:integrase
MAKRPSLFHQLLTSLRNQQRFGESKHQAKRIAIAQAHIEGKSGFGVAPRGVFSVQTFAGYRQTCREFAHWCKDNGNPKTLEEARPYVALYLQYRIDQGMSAWTLQKDRAALRKVYQDPYLASEIELPRRRLKDIKRSRRPVGMDKDFNKELHKELIDFETATGLRRHELAAITPSDIYWRGSTLVARVKQGKGGKYREATVIKGMEDKVLKIIQSRAIDKPIFDNIPKAMDVHSYRALYANIRLCQDEEKQVTHDLGHNRTEVLRGHYVR